MYTESKKGCHLNDGHNFVSSWSICKFISLLQRALNFRQNLVYPPHLKVCCCITLGNWKIRNFALSCT